MTEEKDKQQTKENKAAAATFYEAEKKEKEKSMRNGYSCPQIFTTEDKSKPNVSNEDSRNGNLIKEEPVPKIAQTKASMITKAVPAIDKEEPNERIPAAPATSEKKKPEGQLSTTTV